ncbi:AraC family transcriptional regulator [Pseudonocardia xinjiangensis]|uniref:AraC family transcriptional regulator n=1 Tax=Pseudonocardia xinjiangensis TaxID=75289 RepID=UPI003D8A4C48
MVDPLEHVLTLLSVEGMVGVPLHAGGRWAVAFSGRLDIRCEAVVQGACWVTAEGRDEPLRAEQGDCYLVVGRRHYRLCSDLETPAVPANAVYRDPDGTRRPHPRVGTGHDTTLVGAGFTFDVHAAPLLLGVLPPVVHIPAESGDAAALRATIILLGTEVGGDRLGRAAMLNRLSAVVLLQALRAYAEAGGAATSGWLGASLDPQIGAALRAMHADLAYPWSVPELAGIARMSRSTFSLRFKEAVGASPADYVLRVRMHTAARALRESGRTVASIAAGVGYGSESAFSVAFKRVMGRSPGRHRVLGAPRDIGPAWAS